MEHLHGDDQEVVSDSNHEAALGQATVAAEVEIDLRIVMPAARAGEETAQIQLHTLTVNAIRAALGKYTSTEIDKNDIESSVVEKLLRQNFDPHRRQPHIAGSPSADDIRRLYRAYISRAVSTSVADSFRARQRNRLVRYQAEQRTQGLVPSYTEVNGEVVGALPHEHLAAFLSPGHISTLQYLAEGYEPKEIAELLGIPHSTIKSRIFYARQQVEKHIFEPQGLQRLQSFMPTGSLQYKKTMQLIKEGYIPAVRLAAIWYVKPENLTLAHQAIEPPAHWMYLYTRFPQAVINTFKYRYPERVHFWRQGIYAVKDDVHLLQDIRTELSLKKPPKPPKPGMTVIGRVAQNAQEETYIRKLVVNNTLFSTMHNNRRFVPIQEATAALEAFRQTNAATSD